MDYIKYIELGFVREEMNDSVEYRQTGYYGFSLSKKINDNMLVSVCAGDLDKPKLYIKKSKDDTYHIIHITSEAVIDIFRFINPLPTYQHVC